MTDFTVMTTEREREIANKAIDDCLNVLEGWYFVQDIPRQIIREIEALKEDKT